jgi:hypothetical protein
MLIWCNFGRSLSSCKLILQRGVQSRMIDDHFAFMSARQDHSEKKQDDQFAFISAR